MANDDLTIPEPGSDPSPEPEQKPAPMPPKQRPSSPPIRKGGFVAPLFGGVLAAGIGFGLSHFDLLKLRPSEDQGILKEEIDRVASVVSKLSTDLAERTAALEEGMTAARGEAAAAATAAAEVEARSKAALEGLAALPETVSALGSRIDALDAALKSAATQASDGSVSQATIAALTASVEAMKAELATLQATSATPSDPETLRQMAREEMAAWEAANIERVRAEQAAAETAAKRATALAELHRAAESGAPYAAELAALGDVAVPEIVTKYADKGLPTLASLAEGYPGPARTALEAALRARSSGQLGHRVWSFLRVQTGARSLTPREGSDPDAVLSRAEAALREGRVPDALTELAALPPEGQAAMADWVALAQDHLAATEALATLKLP